MPADTDIISTGTIIDILPGSRFKVKLDSGQDATTYLAGKMRVYSIKIVVGDRVEVALSPYELSKGRITRRL
jgi:translation initiation factor IF-1